MKNETKSQRKEAREMYHYTHCCMRLRQRYGLEMNLDEYRELCRKFMRNEVENPRRDELGNIEAWVQLRDEWICASFKPSDQLVGTIMPAMPARVIAEKLAKVDLNREIKAEHAEIAAKMVEDALTQGEAPRWLGKYKKLFNQTLHNEDIMWYQGRMRDAATYIEGGRIEEAKALLMAWSKLAPQIHPSREEDSVARFVKSRLEAFTRKKAS